VYYSNRAAAYIAIKNFENAISDTHKALKVDPRYFKAYYRMGQANLSLGRNKEAVQAFQSALDHCEKASDKRNIEEQLAIAKQKVSNESNSRSNAASSGTGLPDMDLNNLDFNAMLSNPAIQQMMRGFTSQMGRGADSAPPPPSANAQPSGSDGASSSQTNGQAASGTGNAAANGNNSNNANGDMGNMFQSLASNPQVAAMRNDPQMQPIFEDIQRNGQSAIFKYLNDPAVMAKAASVMGALFNNGGQRPPA